MEKQCKLDFAGTFLRQGKFWEYNQVPRKTFPAFYRDSADSSLLRFIGDDEPSATETVISEHFVFSASPNRAVSLSTSHTKNQSN